MMEQQVKPSWEMLDLQPVCPNSCWEGSSAIPLLTAGVPFLWGAPCIARLQVSPHWTGVSLLLKFILAMLKAEFEN